MTRADALDQAHAPVIFDVNGRAAVLLPEQMRAVDPELPDPDHPGQRPTHWVVVSVEEAYVHCRKHLPRLIRQPVARHWGTDSPLHKGGDPFGVAASRAAESSGEAI